MKIGILTLKLHNNYGGILQAYALCNILNNIGHEAFILSLKENGVKSKLKALLDNNNPLNKFVADNIPTIEISELSQREIVENKISAIIVGSDQVWRPRFTSIPIYFLDFLKNDNSIRKIAYAASFGVDKWEYSNELTEKCKELISKFNLVTVREISGVHLCKQYLNHDASLVLDPTMLLNISVYKNL